MVLFNISNQLNRMLFCLESVDAGMVRLPGDPSDLALESSDFITHSANEREVFAMHLKIRSLLLVRRHPFQ